MNGTRCSFQRGRLSDRTKSSRRSAPAAWARFYRARDTALEREVAIKVLPTDFVDGRERLARFEREAKSLAALNHPNIATIHGFEQDSDAHFLVMELVDCGRCRSALR